MLEVSNGETIENRNPKSPQIPKITEEFHRRISDERFIHYTGIYPTDELCALGHQLAACSENSKSIRCNGSVGPAYESLRMTFIEDISFVPNLAARIDALIPQYSHPANHLQRHVAFTQIPSLGGMTSHRDYARNKIALLTIPLEGRFLFGAGKPGSTTAERENAYHNMQLVRPGDIVAVFAPDPRIQYEADPRPNFCAFAIDYVCALRVWYS